MANRLLPAILPAVYSSVEFPLVPIGNVAAVVLLADGTPGGNCYDIDLIDTGGSGMSAAEAESQARRQVGGLRKAAR